jgi:hypothetical protein
MGSRLAFVALSLSFFGAGCGGAADSDLFGSPNGTGVDAGADVTAKDTGLDTNVPDVAPPPPIDAAPDVTPPPSPVLACGGAVNPAKKCDALTELCCRTGTGAPYNYDCITDPQKCMNSGDVPLNCATNENCIAQGHPGTFCCASLIASGNGTIAYDVSCLPKAQCTAGNAKAMLCNPNAPNPCPNGGNCKLSAQTLTGYYICF